MRYGYIYKTTDLKKNKVYIGQKKGSFNPDYLGSGTLIEKELEKDSEGRFKLKILVYAKSKKELDFLERKFIAEYRKNLGRDKLYNIAAGGNSLYGLCGKDNPATRAEVRAKIGRAMKIRKFSEIHRKRLSIAAKARRHPQIVKNKIRKAMMGNQHLLGKTFTKT